MIELLIDVYGYVFRLFTSDIVNSLQNTVAGVIENIAPIFLIGFSIYILLLAFSWLRGGIDDNFIDTVKSSIGWLIIIAFAFNASNYMSLANVIYELPDRLGAVFVGVDFEDTSAFKAVLDVSEKTIGKIRKTADDLVWYKLLQIGHLMFAGWIIQACAIVLFMLVFAYYLIAKISLLLTLAIGPVFIGFLLYPTTRQYGMNWIGQLLNLTFSIVLYILASSLIIEVSEYVFTAVDDKLGNNVPAFAASYAAFVVLIITILLFFDVFNIPSIASALTGGASVSGSGGIRFITGAVAGMAFARRAFAKSGQSGGTISKSGSKSS